jgi:hypothetical protein
MRWKLLLEEYEYEIQYRAGKRNCNADSLSRYSIHCLNVDLEKLTEERKIKILSEMHDCPVRGHQGINRIVERIKLYPTWPGLEQDVTQYIKQCKSC